MVPFYKVLCAVVHLVGIGLGILYMAVFIGAISTSPDVSILMFAVGSTASYLGVLITIKMVWFDQPQILRMVQTTRIKLTSRKGIMIKMILLCLLVSLCGLNLCFSVFSAFGTDALSPAVDMSLGKIAEIPERFLGANETFFLILLRKTATFTLKLLLIQATNLYNISRIIIMAASLAFLAMGIEFENTVQNENCLRRVIQTYDKLRDAVRATNGVMGGIMLVQYIGVLSFVANSPALRSGNAESTWRLVETYYLTFTYAVSGAFFVVACDPPKRIHMAWKDWMIKKRMCTDLTVDERLLMVTFNQDVEQEPLGLSCTFFTLTYSFLGSMIGLVITYGILIYQIKK